jgi:uncharacterized protein YggE
MQNKYEHLANNSIRVAVVGVLAILALFLFAETVGAVQSFSNPSTPPADTITVSGTGQAAVAPDIAHITFTVQQSASTVAAAQAAATKQANAAIAYVAGQGVASKDVTTLSYDISPQYSQNSVVVPVACAPGEACGSSGPTTISSNTITGYEVDETVQVTVRDLTQVGTILAGLGSQGVQNISGPDFGLEDPTAGTDAARAAAITDAKTQAQTLASQLGVRLGRIVSFSDGSGNYPGPVFATAMSASGSVAAAPSVPAGDNTYSDTVSITYAIN